VNSSTPYSYVLPEERIAQRPVHPPESARMLVIDRAADSVREATFADLPQLVRPSDLLLFNDTKVIPARMFGTLANTAQTPVELLLLERTKEQDTWICIGRPLKKIRGIGTVILNSTLRGHVLEYPHPDRALVRFESEDPEGIQAALFKHGIMPIPPYIRGGISDEQDLIDYQSMFAREAGSVAAPTASLHFSPALMESLRGAGCCVATVTLHVGSASFLPVLLNGELRPPSSERLEVPVETLRAIHQTRAEGKGRVFAVGTTVVRAIESAFQANAAHASAYQCATELFIQPGYRFQALDCLITNFHQPGTTHLLLVEALIGRALLNKAYEYGLKNGFRFLSYGDGMVIV
jgi:S-adenosylmethionine:tRNA ribosyltransferase-isomerase